MMHVEPGGLLLTRLTDLRDSITISDRIVLNATTIQCSDKEIAFVVCSMLCKTNATEMIYVITPQGTGWEQSDWFVSID